MANNKDFIVKNAVEVGGSTKVTVGDAASSGSYTAGYSLDAAAYDSKSFNYSNQSGASQAVYNFALGSNGTKMYTANYSNKLIYQYTLSTAYDISTASYDSKSFSTSSQATTGAMGVTFKTDGTKMYVLDYSGFGQGLYQYSLSTAWDVSTASYDSKVFTDSAYTNTNKGQVFFSSDGTKFYIQSYTNGIIYEVECGTAWDVSTGTSTGSTLNFALQATNSSYGFTMSSDGNYLFVCHLTDAVVYKYDLSTSWDLSTASYSGSYYSAASQIPANRAGGINLNADGTKMYINRHDNSTYDDTIYQYSISNTVTTGSFDLSTGNYFTDTPSADVEYTFSNAGDVQTFQVEVTGAVAGYQISGASYDSKSFSFASQDTAPKTITFNNDGTKMYMQGQATDDVFQYSLSTAYDVSTASYDSVSLDQTSQSNGMSGMTFKPDGTKLYTCDNVNDTVYQYSLSTAWDLSTASYDSISFSVAAQATEPQGIVFNNDGTSMYICDNGNDSVFQYTLSTAYDISTASYASKSFSFASQDTVPQDIKFNADGTKLLMLGNANKYIFQYSLSTAYDVSTASYDSVFYDATAQATSTVYGLSFNGGGDKMYITTATSDTVYQYTTGSAITITWDADIEWAGGTAPDSPAAGEKDLYTITTDDGGTTYIGVQSGDAFS